MRKLIMPLVVAFATLGPIAAYAQVAGESEGLKNAQPAAKKKTPEQKQAAKAEKQEVRATGKGVGIAGESEGLKNAQPPAKKKTPEQKESAAAKKTEVRSSAGTGPVVGDQSPK